MNEDLFDDTMDDMYDDDDFCEFDDTKRLTSLWDVILGKTAPDLLEVPSAHIPSNYSESLAMNSKPDRSVNLNSSAPFVSDSLRMYLTAPPLVRQVVNTEQHCLAIDPTINESESQSLSTPELYIGNLPYATKSVELKNWFISRGHEVSRVSLKTFRRGAGYAFIRFDSIPTAKDVLYKSQTKQTNFIFKGNTLNINPTKRSSKKTTIIPPIVIGTNDTPTTSKFKITDIYYGTLVTGAAMRNTQRSNSVVPNNAEFGIIAHYLRNYEYQTSFTLDIDTEKRKLAIIGEFDSSVEINSQLSGTLKFEWNFRDLKGKKINPVLINQKEVFLLVELKRPPIILETQNTSCVGYDTSSGTRLPGTPLIGHANAWLFRLSADNPRDDYEKLFSILHRYNLSQKQYSGLNIIHLIGSIQAARKNLVSIQLISNDEWMKQNQVKVDDFFNRRWSSYPFETKFEIMKLISKHIITVNDLIVDEQAESILKLCTINTLIALTDKIVEFAPRWFAETCDNEDEDWDNENEQQAAPEEDRLPTAVEDVPTTTDDPSLFQHIRSSATGASINTTNARLASVTSGMTRRSLAPTKDHLGTFSRLLICALEYLLKKYQLYKSTPLGVYVTKLELRTANINPFLIRKIYITPSTILYEGPYREEKCAVTREYVEHQDRFLRVTFRDEDYRVLHNYNDNMSKMYERIKNILINGVNMCDRNYQFLAFSHSQLREHSCWMFASIKNGTTVDTIRQWMGDFQDVRPVAKLAARLGQSFSTSVKGIKLESHHFREVSDYKQREQIGERTREHCFTDGIGIITAEFAKKLSKEMNSSDKSSCPCAFQIRCGGYKGMVCLDVFGRIKEPDISVYFRPSMNKFLAKNFSIDVVRTSLNPSVAYLNRQIILLLLSLGIPNQNFIDLQNHMLRQLKALTGNAQEACESLRYLNEFGGNGFHGFLIAYLRRLGDRKDPFVRRLLLTVKAFLVKELRTKAKIRVQDSWCLLGVIDESRTLKYGQVFIQIDNSNQQKEGPIPKPFQGPVIVTRNPCFHPGDIRKLEAVDIPAFHKLKNVIVFPMDGPRPHAMEMSGGDLDGDTFWISRHPALIFQANEEPFDYQGQEDEAEDESFDYKGEDTEAEVEELFGYQGEEDESFDYQGEDTKAELEELFGSQGEEDGSFDYQGEDTKAELEELFGSQGEEDGSFDYQGEDTKAELEELFGYQGEEDGSFDYQGEDTEEEVEELFGSQGEEDGSFDYQGEDTKAELEELFGSQGEEEGSFDYQGEDTEEEVEELFGYQGEEDEAEDGESFDYQGEDDEADGNKPFVSQGQENEVKDEEPQRIVPYTIKDVCNFFGEYIAADNLGIIANSHLVLADQSPEGAKDDRCLTLARMHSVAVDFAKKGVSASRLTRELRPQEYPHYMEKRDKKSYHSSTILGELYDKIEYHNTDLYLNDDEEITATSSFPYKSFLINETDDYMKDARIIKSEYDRDLKRVMRQYGIKHEAEVVSGYILKFTSKQYAKETKLFELRNEITHAYRAIQDKCLRLFWEEFYQSTDKEQVEWSEVSKKLTWKNQLDVFEYHNQTVLFEKVKQKASAWFRITYEPWMMYIKKNQKNKNNQQEEQHQQFQGLFSFAWMVYPVLLDIFKEHESMNNMKSPREKGKKRRNKNKDFLNPPNKKKR